MSHVKHDAIVVTSWAEDYLKEAHAKAKQIFPHVSEVLPSQINSYHSFFVPPDGSKEGWIDSEEGDIKRAMFIKWCESKAYEDGSNRLEYVVVTYGDTEG